MNQDISPLCQLATGLPQVAKRFRPAFPRKVAAGAGRSPQSLLQRGELRLEQISLSFGGVQALTRINLNVKPGEIRSIIGPNGAGKSSLLNVISGIYPPDSGRIRLSGRSFRQVPVSRLARLGMARTFQNLALFHGLSVSDNIKIALGFQRRATLLEQWIGLGRARREERNLEERTREILTFLDLDAVRQIPAGQLPYGSQKRVELARALVARPAVLLLDEPMAGMTSTDKAVMAAYIRDARDRFGTTIVLIEHDLQVVMGLSDRITVLDYGRIIAEGAPEEVRSNHAVIAAYVGTAVIPDLPEGGSDDEF